MPSSESSGSGTKRPYTSSLNGFGMRYNRPQTTVGRALADVTVDSSELPLKPTTSRNSPESTYSTEVNADEDTENQKDASNVAARDTTESTWSTEVNADEDAEYQQDASNVAASDTEISGKAPVTDKQVADETSWTGGGPDAAQES